MAGICALLAALVFAVFGRTAGFDFVNYDDNVYIYQNPEVLKGFTPDSVGWAFTHVVSSNWHPLTMLSLMLDHQIYGLWPGGYHLTNVALHAATAVLLFLLLAELTGAMLPSAFVAAVFAIHPLRAESVAWIAERKDVLSGLFFVLTLWAYVRYVRRRSIPRYLMVLLWFALGLMSKPMLVTTPFLLVLLDYWPLGRLDGWRRIPRLALEKLPLLGLTVLSCAATVMAQRDAIVPGNYLPFPFRIANAAMAYAIYLQKLFWPAGLAEAYPFPRGGWSVMEVGGALLLLLAVTVAAVLLRKRYPYLMVGWFWYLGMMLPVIGLLQVGQAAYADRYTYLPEIGICIGATWAIAEWTRRLGPIRTTLPWMAGAIVGVLSAAAWLQTGYWQNSVALWSRAIAMTRDNCVADINLGTALLDRKRPDLAAPEFREALRLNPSNANVQYALATALLMDGKLDQGIIECRKSIHMDPNRPAAHYNLAIALLREGKNADAAAELEKTLKLRPDYPGARMSLGYALKNEPKATPTPASPPNGDAAAAS
ncbi:MAG TPA: tetratricopeptide repeat protein [Chthoniobacteraceae bacterium]|jgi:Flp pilus assembly protein TadD|nr:tetratricopeptide repeat protein [Chthoniobacteraceae bacterium]